LSRKRVKRKTQKAHLKWLRKKYKLLEEGEQQTHSHTHTRVEVNRTLAVCVCWLRKTAGTAAAKKKREGKGPERGERRTRLLSLSCVV